jgi:hypothetical protein
MVDRADIDKVAMLLSADWFAPYWLAVGLVVTPEEQSLGQRAARAVVRNLMKGVEVYWSVDFSDRRVSATQSDLLAGLRSSGIDARVIDQISAVMRKQAENDRSVSTSLWLFGALCDQLCAASVDARLDRNLVRVVRALWQGSKNNSVGRIELENALRASNTSWDRYLCGLTPDLPTYLSDSAAALFVNRERFQRFWASLYWMVPQRERRALLGWLEMEAGKLADASFSVQAPEWMRAD